MPLFFDLEALSQRQTDGVLEYIYKAVGEHDHSDHAWDEHPSPFVRQLVELFTKRGLMRLEGFRSELQAWMQGQKHNPGPSQARPKWDGFMYRWTPSEAELVNLYLQSLPPDDWTLDDYMLMVEYTAQKHLPLNAIKTEAEWLAVKASMMGRLQAAIGDGITDAQAERMLRELPGSQNLVVDEFGMTDRQRQVMRFSVNRAAEHVVSLADQARHQMRTIIASDVEARQLGQSGGPSLETKLFDAFSPLNRDWRRIAVTEATEALGQGFIASQRVGARVKRKEQYKGACAWCRKIDGAILTVVDPAKPDKDWMTEVWPGKTNIGRSAAPRKRVGSLLVEREPDERWAIASGTQHPHCRGTWLPVADDSPDDDAEFLEWARGVLDGK